MFVTLCNTTKMQACAIVRRVYNRELTLGSESGNSVIRVNAAGFGG